MQSKMLDLTKDGVNRVHGNLVLSGVTDQTLSVGEGNIGRGSPVTLVIGNDLNTIVLPDTNARVGSSEIDSDSRTFSLAGHYGSCETVIARKKRRRKKKRRSGKKRGETRL